MAETADISWQNWELNPEYNGKILEYVETLYRKIVIHISIPTRGFGHGTSFDGETYSTALISCETLVTKAIQEMMQGYLSIHS